MVCNLKTLIAFMITLSTCFSVNSFAEPQEQAIKLGSSWYRAAFETRFPPAIPSLPDANGWVVLYKNKADLMGEQHDNVFRPITPALNVALSAETTLNPFRKRYPDFYTEVSNRKRLDCPVLGVPFELDDKPTTQEWVVAFSAIQCLSDDESVKLRQGDTEAHYWVLQKRANGQYRVLAEGDGSLHVVNHYKEQGYKEIRTRLLLNRAFPNDELQCGGAEFTWRYRNTGYYLADTEIMAQDCQLLHFPELTGEAWQYAYDEYARRAKVLVDQWVK
ncbi:hypothetical protein SAMN05660964_00582 [Thiothrix caldifontis]|uniref:Uncharacterized protein n=2 Tax=Thiothrix TaxID=1030 RepID=A0A1H3X4M8_9GAMM|nr:hypothetical protein [Thiothrix caldifontis]SDZ94365.1 hypothetical protein SAMN05660964_00582 [Thiothrix caldifontis]